jgi:AcrR family transcriptional regulator
VTQGAHERNDERSRRRRETILDAAFHVFSRVGYRDAAVDEIAERAATSKGGLYFHFPTKQALFVELMRTTADKLADRVDREVAAHSDPIAQADAALRTVLATFSGHRTMARLLIVDALGAGRDFRAEIERLHARFAGLIEGYLDQAVADGIIPPIDTRIASQAWFGALNEVVTRWLVAEKAGPLEDAYPALRRILFRGVGISDDQIGRLRP